MNRATKTILRSGILTCAAIACWYRLSAAEYRVPGVNYAAQTREGMAILPGGRVLRPFGRQLLTGTGTFAVGVNPSGKTIVCANLGISSATGINRPSLTIIIPGKNDTPWNLTDLSAETPRAKSRGWQGLSTGLAVLSDGSAWVSEGDTGRVLEVGLSNGNRKEAVNLDGDGVTGSFSDRLVIDAASGLMAVLDQANFRAVLVNVKRGIVLSSIKTGILPSALALSANGKRLYVASTGIFGTKREPASLAIVDISDTAVPHLVSTVPLGAAGSDPSPAGVLVQNGFVFVSLSNDDSVAVVNASTGKLDSEIPLRIPGLESYRGITPLGMAFDQKSGRLLVAEAGINAVAVIDPGSRKVLGHLPVGWFPTSIDTHEGQIYVANARGMGTGPSMPPQRFRFWGSGGRTVAEDKGPTVLRRGSVSVFAIPATAELDRQTQVVIEANGFRDSNTVAKKKPPVKYVVVIVKGNRSFDDVFGDVEKAGGRQVFGEPEYARFGLDGYVSGGKQHFSLRVPVTPNLHALGERWTVADNFYADSYYPDVAERWLEGDFAGWWSETGALFREAGNRTFGLTEGRTGDLWKHLAGHNVEYLNLCSPPDLAIPDQRRADQVIARLQKDYLEPGKALPRFVFLNLPNDTAGSARPGDGYQYEAAYVADSDLATGRVVEFLSKTPWWREMAIFVTGSGASGGPDHIDSHRIPMVGVGPWFRTNYVSHTNASFPSLLKTVFQLLDLPPMSLYDASAADLSDMFANAPDFGSYDVKPEDSRLWDPGQLK